MVSFVPFNNFRGYTESSQTNNIVIKTEINLLQNCNETLHAVVLTIYTIHHYISYTCKLQFGLFPWAANLPPRTLISYGARPGNSHLNHHRKPASGGSYSVHLQCSVFLLCLRSLKCSSFCQKRSLSADSGCGRLFVDYRTMRWPGWDQLVIKGSREITGYLGHGLERERKKLS